MQKENEKNGQKEKSRECKIAVMKLKLQTEFLTS